MTTIGCSGTGQDAVLPGRVVGAPIVIVGLGYGDESKGATVDFLASQIPDVAAVVRWSGEPRRHTTSATVDGTTRSGSSDRPRFWMCAPCYGHR